jgi:hypothetical protein
MCTETGSCSDELSESSAWPLENLTGAILIAIMMKAFIKVIVEKLFARIISASPIYTQ